MRLHLQTRRRDEKFGRIRHWRRCAARTRRDRSSPRPLGSTCLPLSAFRFEHWWCEILVTTWLGGSKPSPEAIAGSSDVNPAPHRHDSNGGAVDDDLCAWRGTCWERGGLAAKS